MTNWEVAIESPEEIRRRSAEAGTRTESGLLVAVLNQVYHGMAHQLGQNVRTAAAQGATSASVELSRKTRLVIASFGPQPWPPDRDSDEAKYRTEAAEMLRRAYEAAGYRATISSDVIRYTETVLGEMASAYGGNIHTYEAEIRALWVDWRTQERQ